MSPPMIKIASMNTAVEQARLIREDMLRNPRPNQDLSKKVEWKVIARACVTSSGTDSLMRIDSWRYPKTPPLAVDRTDSSQAPEIFHVVSGILAPQGINWNGAAFYNPKQIDYDKPDIRWAIPHRFTEDGLTGAMRLFWPVDVETAWRERFAISHNILKKITIGSQAHSLIDYLIGNAHDWRDDPANPYPGVPADKVDLAEKIHQCDRKYWTHTGGARTGRKLISELKKIL